MKEYEVLEVVTGQNKKSGLEEGLERMGEYRSLGIKEATFQSGGYFNNGDNSTILAENGVIIEEDAVTVSTTHIKPGSSFEEAVENLAGKNHTQKVIAGACSSSQPTISGIKSASLLLDKK